MDKRWRCMTCGFVWPKDEPPSACPVCGAPRSEFSPLSRWKSRLVVDIARDSKVHPMAVHVPNGVLPVTLFFLLLALLTGDPGLEAAAFYPLLLVLAVVPIALASGLHEWKHRHGRRKVPVFYWKIRLAVTLLVLLAAAAAVRLAIPDIMGRELRWIYVALYLATLPVIVLLGHFGGKLTFGWKKFPEPGHKT